jgi:hypothetical protein
MLGLCIGDRHLFGISSENDGDVMHRGSAGCTRNHSPREISEEFKKREGDLIGIVHLDGQPNVAATEMAIKN